MTDLYQIRMATAPATCADCGDPVAGPVGCRGEEPICTLCLLDVAPALGRLLHLARLVRDLAAALRGARDPAKALDELRCNARLYARFLEREGWPHRVWLPLESYWPRSQPKS